TPGTVFGTGDHADNEVVGAGGGVHAASEGLANGIASRKEPAREAFADDDGAGLRVQIRGAEVAAFKEADSDVLKVAQAHVIHAGIQKVGGADSDSGGGARTLHADTA